MAKIKEIPALAKFIEGGKTYENAWTTGFLRGIENCIATLKESTSLDEAMQKLEADKEKVELIKDLPVGEANWNYKTLKTD